MAKTARDRGFYWRRCVVCGGTGVCADDRCIAREVESYLLDPLGDEYDLLRHYAFTGRRCCHSCNGRGRITVGLRDTPPRAGRGAALPPLADGPLTRQLAMAPEQSPLRTWIDRRFPACATVARALSRKVEGPVLIEPFDESGHATVGTAFDHRVALELLGSPASPRLVVEGLVYAYLARTFPDGVPPASEGDQRTVTIPPTAPEIVFFGHLRDLLASIHDRPDGTQAHELSRAAIVLGLFTEASRSGGVSPGSPLSQLGPAANLGELLRAIPAGWVTDLTKLAEQSRVAIDPSNGRKVVVAPTFPGSEFVGGADGDLLINGRLVELKVSTARGVSSGWLRQLVSYVLLDFYDQLEIREVGLYLARRGLMLTWGVDDFLTELGDSRSMGTFDLEGIRSEFRSFLMRSTPAWKARRAL